MNKVILMGRLTRDPEVRYSTSGDGQLAIARYTLAVDRRFKRDEVLDCVNGEIKLNPLFEFVEYGETEELVEGKLEARNRLVNTEKLERSGLSL